MQSKSSPFGFFFLAICAAIILPLLFMDGMFMDGEMYSAVAHNLSLGNGTPWMLYYTDGFMGLGTFHENPPLGTWLMSAFFWAFGSSIFVERFYILCTLFASAFLIKQIWRRLVPQLAQHWWMPVFLFISIPTVHWGYRHNLMENTMLIFVLCSVIWLIKSFENKNLKWSWFVASALAVSGAFLVKGPTGLFPLAAIFGFWIAYKNVKITKIIWLSVIYVVLVLAPIVFFFFWPASAQSMENYFFYRTLKRIDELPTVANRLWIAGEWLMQFVVPAAFAFIIAALARKKALLLNDQTKRSAVFFVFLGLCGFLPLMLTKVQRTFYLITSFPFFAMALSVFVLPYFLTIQTRISTKWNTFLKWGATTIFVATLFATLSLAGMPKRDFLLLEDVEKVATFLGDQQKIASSPEVTHLWKLKAYLMRKHQIQFVIYDHFKEASFIIIQKDEAFEKADFCPINLELHNFLLLKKCE